MFCSEGVWIKLLQRRRQTLGFTWDHFTVFPSSVLIVYAHPRLHTLGAAGPTAGQVFAGGIFIAVH